MVNVALLSYYSELKKHDKAKVVVRKEDKS